MKLNWAYQVPFFHFDEAGTGGATPAPVGGTPAATTAPSSTPAPSAAPSPPAGGGSPSSPPEPGSASGSDPFGGLDTDFDGDDVIVLEAAPPTDGGAAPPAGTDPAAPAATAAPVATAPVPPVVAPAAVAPVAAADGTSPASTGDPLNDAIDGFIKHGKELATHAGQTIFKLSDEDAAALATNAEEVIPRLMGQVYTQSIAAAGNLMRNFIPQMIEQAVGQINSRTEKSREAIDEFYTANPDLNVKDHSETVKAWAKQFRQANPKATRADAIAFVARAVRLQHGLPVPGTAQPQVAVRPQPFAPARPGGRAPTAPAAHDPFAGLDQDFDE